MAEYMILLTTPSRVQRRPVLVRCAVLRSALQTGSWQTLPAHDHQMALCTICCRIELAHRRRLALAQSSEQKHTLLKKVVLQTPLCVWRRPVVKGLRCPSGKQLLMSLPYGRQIVPHRKCSCHMQQVHRSDPCLSGRVIVAYQRTSWPASAQACACTSLSGRLMPGRSSPVRYAEARRCPGATYR
jgi:hypothetical protein